MRTLDMTTFVSLARNRHFGRTAQDMNTTQPAISARLSLIEQEYGCRLVQRGDKGFRLTPEGERVLVVFQDVLETLGRLQGETRNGDVPTPAVVRIGAIDSVAGTWMPLLIETLSDTMPNLRVELTVEGTKNLIAGLGKGEFDLIFGIDPAIGEGFSNFVACEFEMIWTGSPKIVRDDMVYGADDLARMPIITFPKGTPPYLHIAPYFQDENVLASKMTSSNSLFAIISLLKDGFGIGTIPTVTIEHEIDAGLLVRMQVSKPFPPMPIIGSYQTSVGQKLVSLVVNYARRSAEEFCRTAKQGSAWLV